MGRMRAYVLIHLFFKPRGHCGEWAGREPLDLLAGQLPLTSNAHPHQGTKDNCFCFVWKPWLLRLTEVSKASYHSQNVACPILCR